MSQSVLTALPNSCYSGTNTEVSTERTSSASPAIATDTKNARSPFIYIVKSPTQGSRDATENHIINEESGPTVMSNSYSQNEVDLKLELVEQRVDHKLDKILAQVQEGFSALQSHFDTTLAHMEQKTDQKFVQLENRFITLDHKVDIESERNRTHLTWIQGLLIATISGVIVIIVGGMFSYLQQVYIFQKTTTVPSLQTQQSNTSHSTVAKPSN